MKIKQYILIIIILLLTSFLHSQTTPQFQWVKGGGSAGTGGNVNPAMESCKWLGTDAHGNIYGMSSIFDYGIQIDTSVIPVGWGYDDFAVFSYRCDGSMRWVRYFGSSLMDYTGGMTVDLDGNVFVSGHVAIGNSGLNVDGHFGDTTVLGSTSYNRSAFIAKLDSNGHTVWLSLPGAAINNIWLKFLTMESDNQGNQCILVRFYESGSWCNYTIPEKGFYVARVNKNNGDIMDLTKVEFNISNNNEIIDFSMDEFNNYYLNLLVDDTAFFGNNFIFSNIFDTNPYINYLILKYSPSGSFVWHKALGSDFVPGYEKQLIGKTIIKNNKLYISGFTYNNMDIFGTIVNNPYLLHPLNSIPIIACFDSNNGNFIKLNYLYLNKYTRESVITVSDKVYMANITSGMVWLNQAKTDTIKPYGGEYSKAYPFIVAIDTNLNQFEWGVATKVTGDFTRIEALTVDLAGNIYAGGKVTDSIYDSFGSGYQAIGGSSDFFIAKISTHNDCGCIKSQPFPQLLGINNKTVTVKGTATGIADSLYWSWGDGTTTPYTAQNTNITHTYATGGNYTVCLHTINYCGTMDSCLSVNSVGIYEQQLIYLNAYPNPVTNNFTIENPYQCNMQLNIYSITGKLLYSHTYESYSTTIDMGIYESGIYFIEMILADGRKTVRKVIKQ